MIKSPEELFNERYGEPKDKWDKKAQKYDYYDMIDFAEFLGEYYGFYTETKKETLKRLYKIIDSDATAIAFQTLGQYRTFLRNAVRDMIKL